MRLSEQRTELVKVILEREHFIVLMRSVTPLFCHTLIFDTKSVL